MGVTFTCNECGVKHGERSHYCSTADVVAYQGMQPLRDRINELEAELRAAEEQVKARDKVLKTILDDMGYKPVHFDWPTWASKWYDSIREALKGEAK